MLSGAPGDVERCWPLAAPSGRRRRSACGPALPALCRSWLGATRLLQRHAKSTMLIEAAPTGRAAPPSLVVACPLPPRLLVPADSAGAPRHCIRRVHCHAVAHLHCMALQVHCQRLLALLCTLRPPAPCCGRRGGGGRKAGANSGLLRAALLNAQLLASNHARSRSLGRHTARARCCTAQTRRLRPWRPHPPTCWASTACLSTCCGTASRPCPPVRCSTPPASAGSGERWPSATPCGSTDSWWAGASSGRRLHGANPGAAALAAAPLQASSSLLSAPSPQADFSRSSAFVGSRYGSSTTGSPAAPLFPSAQPPPPADAPAGQATAWRAAYRERAAAEDNWRAGRCRWQRLRGHKDYIRCAQLQGSRLATCSGSYLHKDVSIRCGACMPWPTGCCQHSGAHACMCMLPDPQHASPRPAATGCGT